jgi:hypothetical protein
MDIMKNGSKKRSVVEGEYGECVHKVAGSVKNKPCIFNISQCPSGDDIGPPENIAPYKIPETV